MEVVESWQAKFSMVKERNRYAFENSLFCDVEFSVFGSNGENVTLKAHKYVLAISSPVFETMFYGELAETGPTIDLPDCTKEGIEEMLHYVYSDEVTLTGRNVIDVLYLAQKYMMPFLENKCMEYLQKELRPEDVFIVLQQARQIRNEQAERCCWNVIDFETNRAVTSEPFLDVSRELLCEVLERETLHTEEIALFKAVDRWASNQIKEERLKNDGATKREVLGEDAIQLLRFPVMSSQEFAKIVLDKEILLGNEVTEIIQVLSNVAPSGKKFTTTKRKGQWRERWSSNRYASLARLDTCHRDFYWNGKQSQEHSITFQVNKPIFLAGVRLFAERYHDSKVNVKLSIFARRKRQLIYLRRSFMLQESTLIAENCYGFSLYFGDQAVPLEPKQWYTIEAELSGKLTWFLGSEGRDTIKCDDVVLTFIDDIIMDTCIKNYTTVEKGQFPSFLLKTSINLE